MDDCEIRTAIQKPKGMIRLPNVNSNEQNVNHGCKWCRVACIHSMDGFRWFPSMILKRVPTQKIVAPPPAFTQGDCFVSLTRHSLAVFPLNSKPQKAMVPLICRTGHLVATCSPPFVHSTTQIFFGFPFRSHFFSLCDGVHAATQ